MAIGYAPPGQGGRNTPPRPAPKAAATPAPRTSETSSIGPVKTQAKLPGTGSGGGGGGASIGGILSTLKHVAAAGAQDVERGAKKVESATLSGIQSIGKSVEDPFVSAFKAGAQKVRNADRNLFTGEGIKSNIQKLRQELKNSRKNRGY